MVILWKLTPFGQVANTIDQMTILRGFWMSTTEQSRYHVYWTSSIDCWLTGMEFAGNLNIHYVPGACARHVSNLQFYFTKDYFDIIIIFVGENDL